MKKYIDNSADATWLPAATKPWAVALALGLSLGITQAAHADNLAEAATNPIGNMVQMSFQDQYNWSNYNSDGYSNAFILQPVIPFKLNWDAVPTLVTRTTLPVVTTPDLGDPVGRKNGLGDLLFMGFFIPKIKLKKQMIGLGPAISAPTATSDFTGSGKWSLGPAFVYINMQIPKLQYGVLAWQLWDIAGKDYRGRVNTTYFQPFITKHLNKGWYVGTPDIPGTYNWESNNFTFPFGLKVGKVTKIGKQPVNIFGEVLGNPWDDGSSPEWSAKLSVTFLFPD